jgi:biopolymer transport protein ExbD
MITQLAVAQAPSSGSVLRIKVSADGMCHFLDNTIACSQLGSRLLSIPKAKNADLQFEVDPATKQVVLDTANDSLRRAGFKTIGYITNEFF